MSTTFDVIPGSSSYVSFDDLFSHAQRNLNRFLASIGVKQEVEIRAELMFGDSRRTPNKSERFAWPHDMHLWISVQGVPGGTDVYCDRIIEVYNAPDDPWDPWMTLNDFERAIGSSDDPKHEIIFQARKLDMMWTFRRSAGQHSLTSVSYGIIAATLADLTGGLLSSEDGAWEMEVLPATGAEFFETYFKPDRTSDPDCADWARRCIRSIREHFQ